MSDIVDTINRVEAWVRNYGHEKQPAFIADLQAIIRTAKAVSRAVDWLEKAQRYDLACYPTGAVLERCTHGDYVDIGDVRAAIDILQEGQQ